MSFALKKVKNSKDKYKQAEVEIKSIFNLLNKDREKYSISKQYDCTSVLMDIYDILCKESAKYKGTLISQINRSLTYFLVYLF